MSRSTFKNKLLLTTAITTAAFAAPYSAKAADVQVNGAQVATQTATVNDDRFMVSTGDSIIVTGAGIDSSTFTNVGVVVNTGVSTTGISTTGLALDYTDALTTVGEITVTSGIITSSGSATAQFNGAADTFTIDVDAGASVTNTAAGGDVFVMDADGTDNYGVTVTNDGTISGTNDAGTVVFNLADADGGSTLNITNGVTGIINGGALGTAISVTGGANGLTLANAGAITGAITVGGAGTAAITQTAGSMNGNITLGTGVSTIGLSGGTVNGNIVLGGANSTLTLNGGNLNGNVTTATDGTGNVVIGANYTAGANEHFGVNDTGTLGTVTVNAGFTLNTATNNTNLNATTISLAGIGSTLTLGSGTFEGAITSGIAGEGVVNFNRTTGTTTTGALGATRLDQINIAAGGTVNSTGSVQSDTITLGSGSTLGVAGTDFRGVTNGAGTINFTSGGTTTLGASTSIGQTTAATAINIATATTVTAAANNSAIKAGAINLAGTGALTTGTGLLTGNVTMAGAGTLTLGGAYSGTINGTTGSGTVIFGATQTTGGNIGGSAAATAVSLVRVNDGATVTLDDNLRSTTLTIGQGTTGILTQTAGAVNTTTTAIAAGGKYNLNGGTSAGAVTIATGGEFNLNTAGAFTGSVNGAAGGQGIFNVGADYTSTVKIGTTGLAAVNIASGKALTLGGDLTALTTTVTGTLNAGNTSRVITGALVEGAAGTINLGSGTHTGVTTLTTVSGSTLATTITGATAGTTITGGSLATSGTTNNIVAGTKLAVNLLDNATYIANGATYDMITGGAGAPTAISNANISVNGATGADSNKTGVLTFTTAANGSNLAVNVARVSYASLAQNAQADAIGDLLNTAGSAGTGFGGSTTELRALQLAADKAKDAAALTEVLDNAIGESDGSSSDVALASSDVAMNTFEGRMADVRTGGSSGVSSGDAASAGNAVWVRGFGSTATRDNKSGTNGYDADTAGMALGVDTELNDSTIVGLGLAYANSTVDSNTSGKSTDVVSYQLIGYATKNLADNNYVEGLLSLGINNYDTTRAPAPGVVASGDFDGTTYMARVGGGHVMNAGEGIEIIPNAGLTYGFTETDNYTETGAGVLNLSVDNEDVSILQPKIGVDFVFNGSSADGMKFRPELRLGYQYDLLDTAQSSTTSLAGVAGTFTTESADRAKGLFNVGAGVDLATSENVTLSADYDYQINSDFNSHNGMLNLRYGF